MPYYPPRIALYCQGTFSVARPTVDQKIAMINAATEIAWAGFDTVILGQWHVQPNGSLYYNDADDVEWMLSNIPGLLKSEDKVQHVMITFGPFGGDFNNITANIDLFKEHILDIFSRYDVDGIDFDIKASLTAENQATLAELTDWLYSLGKIVTASPYNYNRWWEALLRKTDKFEWWNLQVQAGADYAAWVGYLADISDNAQSFLHYGFNTLHEGPDSVIFTLQSMRKKFPGLNGAFISKYETIAGRAYQWALAIHTGLSSVKEACAL
jgi:hypothetical protein